MSVNMPCMVKARLPIKNYYVLKCRSSILVKHVLELNCFSLILAMIVKTLESIGLKACPCLLIGTKSQKNLGKAKPMVRHNLLCRPLSKCVLANPPMGGPEWNRAKLYYRHVH